MYDYEENNPIGVLLGQTLRSVLGMEADNDEVFFIADTGRRFKMLHHQDCCENVRLVEVIGDPSDLIGSPITVAEERVSRDSAPAPKYPDSWTWTFYELATNKGSVTLRWLGESNGYYSEAVDFVEVKTNV